MGLHVMIVLRLLSLRTAISFLLLLHTAQTWHGLDNSIFHCWPLNASAASPTPYSQCPGLDVDWLEAPPDRVKAERTFNVTYHLSLSEVFYDWAVLQGIFDKMGYSGDSAGAKTWCETTVCPSNPALANETNCCVHHVNVHSCPLTHSNVTNGLCGPWIPAQGSIITHSDVMVGPVTTGNWTSVVAGLYQVGMTSLIAHFKMAGMHVAVEKTLEVLPKTVCGDSLCEDTDGENCDVCPADCGDCPLSEGQVAAIVVVCLLLVVGIAFVIGYMGSQRRKMLWDESWIVPSVFIHEDGGRGALGSNINLGMSRVSLGNVSNHAAPMHATANARQTFCTVASVHGRLVAVKRVNCRQFQLTRDIRREVRDVRSLEHTNLCGFVGGCLEPDNVCILYEYCSKGSLPDVLQNDQLPLNWSFRLSLASDVARGMAFLHKNRMVHGNLKSSNCLVDERWVCKVTDFGLKNYRREDQSKDPDDEMERRRKEEVDRIYKAPEVRHSVPNSKTTHPKAGKSAGTVHQTPAADVYAFAVILIEIATRDDPYGDEEPGKVSDDWKPPLPELPTKNGNSDADSECPSPKEYNQLVTRCWSDQPDDRPTFDSIKRTLYRINPSKLSPVDMMMAMMANYQHHLESVVEERTQDLMAEKERSDQLLYSMLPRQVADQLRQGIRVRAEQFSACTVYFSDIVGFTTLAAASSPLQVVALLNQLYTTFDAILEQYEVYKVETIGDAYMVVSGVPTKTPDHARNVSAMALALVRECRTFRIPHLPGHPLQIRVGIHSGPVCAGVVGTKMPRYCLFGDTVNTASRMESNGEAYKIHLSDDTYRELERYNEFEFEARGTIPVKGKGDMSTWWLLGRKNPDVSVTQENPYTDVTEEDRDGDVTGER